MPGPDFLIIGAMKCGTSTLQVQLAEQDGIFMTTPKEPNFFSDDDVHARGLDWYLSLFATAAPGDLRGEASTHYTKLPTYPETLARMSRALTRPKLVYMIRNPVERAISHYIHEWSKSQMGNDPVSAFARHGELVDYGRYAMQIAPFIDAFGRESIHLTSLEILKADPQAELEAICRHIGFGGPGPVWNTTTEPQNTAAERYRPLPMQTLLVDNPVAQRLRHLLVPKSLRAAIRKRRGIGERPRLPEGLRGQLERVFAEDRERLAELFPRHPALTLSYPFLAR